MATMRLKRFYRFQAIDTNGISAVRGILNQRFENEAYRAYTLCYPSEELVLTTFDDVSSVVAKNGPPARVKIEAQSSGGRYACLDATNRNSVKVEYYSRQVDPTEVDPNYWTTGERILERGRSSL